MTPWALSYTLPGEQGDATHARQEANAALSAGWGPSDGRPVWESAV
jgi:hypothetical protein